MTMSGDLTEAERADATLVVRLLGNLAQSASSQRGGDVELRLLRAAAAVAGDTGLADDFVADCLALLGSYLTARHDHGAVPVLRREVAIREQHADPAPLAPSFGRLSRALENSGQLAEAVHALTAGFTAARAAGSPDLAVVLLFDRARILGTKLARFGDAMQALHMAHDISRQTGVAELQERAGEQLRAALTWILRMAGEAEDAGDTDTAAEHYRLVNESARIVEMRDLAALAQYNYATMLGATLRRPTEALPRAEEAVALASEGTSNDLLERARQLVLAIRSDLGER